MRRLKVSLSIATERLEKQHSELEVIRDQFNNGADIAISERNHQGWEEYTKQVLASVFEDALEVEVALFKRVWHPPVYVVTPGYRSPTDREPYADRYSQELVSLKSIIQALPLAMAPSAAVHKAAPLLASTPIKIFISHSAKDKDFAAAVVDLLEATLNIPPDAIRCTSVDGYKLEAGDSPETLRLNIQSCDVLVALLTPASLESGFVLMELGAAWGFNKRICPVLAPRLTFNLLPGPSGPLHAVMADDRVGMSGVIDAVHKATQLSYRDNPRRERGMGGYMRQIPSLFPSSP